MKSSLMPSSCNPQRRHLLGSVVAASALQFAPRSWAAQLAASPAHSAFMALSRYLTDRTDFSAELAERMQAALLGLDSNFIAQTDTLWQWIQSSNIAVNQLNARLKAEKPELAMLPGRIMQAWCLGIVGEGEQAKVVAYEFALNAQIVSDKLRPPTYSYGLPGSWTSNPTTFNLQRINVPA